MASRKIKFGNGNYYHIYNRGVDKRDIVLDENDRIRFLKSIDIFNTTESVGSIFAYEYKKDQLSSPTTKLVELVAFNLLDNHMHIVLREITDGGISKYMKNVNCGYTRYFNEKYKRSGALFQGQFKAEFIPIEELENIVAYVNLNHIVHKLASADKWGIRSSWDDYTKGKFGIVKVDKMRNFNRKNSIEKVKKIIKNRKDKEDRLKNSDK